MLETDTADMFPGFLKLQPVIHIIILIVLVRTVVVKIMAKRIIQYPKY